MRAGPDWVLLDNMESGRLRRFVDLCKGRVRTEASGVSLIRQLPWDQSAVALQVEQSAAAEGQPTHLLLGNKAYALDGRSLNLGTQAVAGERFIDLAHDMPGISRRHCSLNIRNGQCVVEDHSRYGTFLNGHRITGSAVLAVGDLLRVGTPGFELRLISVEATNGS